MSPASWSAGSAPPPRLAAPDLGPCRRIPQPSPTRNPLHPAWRASPNAAAERSCAFVPRLSACQAIPRITSKEKVEKNPNPSCIFCETTSRASPRLPRAKNELPTPGQIRAALPAPTRCNHLSTKIINPRLFLHLLSRKAAFTPRFVRVYHVSTIPARKQEGLWGAAASGHHRTPNNARAAEPTLDALRDEPRAPETPENARQDEWGRRGRHSLTPQPPAAHSDPRPARLCPPGQRPLRRNRPARGRASAEQRARSKPSGEAAENSRRC